MLFRSNIGSNLLIVSLKKSGTYYDAMEARCYDGELNFLVDERVVTWQQVLLAAIFLLLLLAIKILVR